LLEDHDTLVERALLNARSEVGSADLAAGLIATLGFAFTTATKRLARTPAFGKTGLTFHEEAARHLAGELIRYRASLI
jgi:hypothetical protein